jgi:uncharacterized protein YuzB (UPF0349 family)
MISICPCCSRMDYEKIEKLYGENFVEIGCLGRCEPYENQCFGLIDDELYVTNTEEEFLELINKNLKK